MYGMVWVVIGSQRTMEHTGCPETSVTNQSTLRNVLEERRSHLHGGECLKLRLKLWQASLILPSRSCLKLKVLRGPDLA